jgi:hypothetical protein
MQFNVFGSVKFWVNSTRAKLILALFSIFHFLPRWYPHIGAGQKNRNITYLRFLSDYSSRIPKEIKRHREYYCQNQRGFGEDAFHSAWFRFFEVTRPVNCLEIGVYRGQTISLWALLGKSMNFAPNIYGISPLSDVGDEHGTYLKLEYTKDIESHFEYFRLPQPTLLRASSTDEIAISMIQNNIWDLIYIDGSHEYETAKKDYENAKIGLKLGGYLVLDDSSLNTNYYPQTPKSTRGWPGPSRVFDEISL